MRKEKPLPWAEGAVFLLALGVRLAYLLQIRANPFFTRPVIDAKMYDDWALQIAGGHLIGEGVFTQAPLYPYVLGLVYGLLGHDYFLARLVQIVLGAVNCALVVALGRRAFSPRVGLLAGVVASLYATMILFDAELLRPCLVTFLSLVALLALFAAAERPSRPRWAGAGLVLGLAAITWEAVLLFVPAALLWMHGVLRGRRSHREILRSGACLCAAVACAILPVTLRNYAVSGDVVLVSAWGGVNFYLGNNPAAARTMSVQPGEQWQALLELPARAGVARPSLQSRWFYREAFAFIREHPLGWLGLLGRKVLLFWDGAEFDPNNDLPYFRTWSPLLALLFQPSWRVVVPFGVVAPLALAGMLLSAGRSDRARLLLFYVLALMSALVLYHTRARYRLPAVPVLVLFAARAADLLSEALRDGPGRRRAAIWIAGVLALAAFVNADVLSLRAAPAFPLHTTLGKIHLERGRLREARAEFEAAVAADPNDADALVNLGVIHEREGRGAEALAAFREAARVEPDYALAHNNIGVWYSTRGRYDEAVAALRTAVRLKPTYADAFGNLGIALAGKGLPAEASAAFAEAARLRSGGAGAPQAAGAR